MSVNDTCTCECYVTTTSSSSLFLASPADQLFLCLQETLEELEEKEEEGFLGKSLVSSLVSSCCAFQNKGVFGNAHKVVFPHCC